MSETIKLEGFDEASKLLDKISVELPRNMIPRALKAAATPVVAAAKANAPRSKVTGTWFKQSKKQREESPTPLANTITSVVRSYDNGVSVAVIGPKHPTGAHGHLVERGHKAVYWKRDTGWNFKTHWVKSKQAWRKGRVKRRVSHGSSGARVEGKEFLAPAADSTKSEQQRLLIVTLEEAIKAAGG